MKSTRFPCFHKNRIGIQIVLWSVPDFTTNRLFKIDAIFCNHLTLFEIER
jgi:hypothetical protein